MIATTINYACDVAGCDSKAETKEVFGMGFGGLPKGWAELNWLKEAAPDGDDVKVRAARALKKMIAHMPPEVGEYQQNAFEMMGGGEVFVPRQIACKAIICEKCLDKINLGDFQTPDFLAPGRLR
jgi:hypothetical protein